MPRSLFWDEAVRAFCQEWTLDKSQFARLVWAKSRLQFRVVLAWMAYESGGEHDRPAGADYNYLQIKGVGQAGSASGFKRYRNVPDAARDAIANIKRRGINQFAGKGPERQMDAIAQRWATGPNNPPLSLDAPEVRSYRDGLQAKFNCISVADINDQYHLDDRDRRRALKEISRDAADEDGRPPRPGIADRIAGAVGDAIGDAASGLAGALWKPLLQASLSGFGLALIGYGIVKMVGSSTAGEAVKQNAGPAAAALREAR